MTVTSSLARIAREHTLIGRNRQRLSGSERRSEHGSQTSDECAAVHSMT
jgi:hypothetical protein